MKDADLATLTAIVLLGLGFVATEVLSKVLGITNTLLKGLLFVFVLGGLTVFTIIVYFGTWELYEVLKEVYEEEKRRKRKPKILRPKIILGKRKEELEHYLDATTYYVRREAARKIAEKVADELRKLGACVEGIRDLCTGTHIKFLVVFKTKEGWFAAEIGEDTNLKVRIANYAFAFE